MPLYESWTSLTVYQTQLNEIPGDFVMPRLSWKHIENIIEFWIKQFCLQLTRMCIFLRRNRRVPSLACKKCRGAKQTFGYTTSSINTAVPTRKNQKSRKITTAPPPPPSLLFLHGLIVSHCNSFASGTKHLIQSCNLHGFQLDCC